MSKSMFANPKAALGFAGVTIAIAIAASFSAGMFVPGGDAQPEEVTANVVEAPSAPQAAAPATSWAEAGDDEDFGDDWSDAATSTASNRGWNESSSGDEMAGPAFGDYSPETSGAPRQARSSASRSEAASGARVRSSASPDAPPLDPPRGGNDNPEISIAD
ncbi:hypothetical protein [uncultured Erythrobacter sp.]|uniref:hypothetical protein n=1 Tax=uncultured Erythrobacter sp. TaxID=263913 RepID=UPI00261F3EDD|nr:hypothetical protein [uncultured Erythrobacter sp.]